MSFAEIIGAAVGFIREIQAAKLPEVIHQNFGPGSPREGQWSHNLVIKREANGAFCYLPSGAAPAPARAELEENHDTFDLASFRALAGNRTVFVSRFHDQGVLVSAIDTQHPENGTIHARLIQSPAFERWSLFEQGQIALLSHEQLADALLDGAEDLVDPKDRLPFVAFRGAQVIEYEADFEQGSSKVSVGYQKSGKVAGTTSLALPRSIRVNLEGVEGVSAVAEFRIRVVPPKGDQKEPSFRVQFANCAEWKSQIEQKVAAQIIDLMPGSLVVRGAPDSRRFAG